MEIQKKRILVFAVVAALVIAGIIYSDLSKEASAPFPDADKENGTADQMRSEDVPGSKTVKLSGLELFFPAGWTMSEKTGSSVSVGIPGLDSSAIFTVEKCEDTGDFSCFGSGRTYVQKTTGGADLYDLLSMDTGAYFGLDFGTEKPVLYRVSVEFGDYKYTEEDLNAIRSVLASVKEAR